MILKLIAGPLIGMIIGYFTNWLAVKMLFRPRGRNTSQDDVSLLRRASFPVGRNASQNLCGISSTTSF